MPDGTSQQIATQQQVVPVENLANMRFDDALEAYAPRWTAVLPPNISVDHFKGIVITAVNLNPELRYADRRTFFNACTKCASDGLLPDGREAHLQVYRTRVKDRDGNEHWIDAVQYMPMIHGIRKRMRNSGEVLSSYAEVVYQRDRFHRQYGDEPRIEHEPPPLGQERGAPVGAYAIIKLVNGEVLRDVMTVKDIERSRAQSKQPNGLMWATFWDEGAKKTVLRRCSKQAPTASTLERLLARDDEEPELPPAEELPAIPPRPRRMEFADFTDDGTRVIDQQGETKGETAGKQRQPEPYRVVGLAGDVKEYATAADAAQGFQAANEEAAGQKGAAGIDAVWDSNGELIHDLRQQGYDEIADELVQYYTEQLAAAEAADDQRADQAASAFWAQQDLHIPPPTYKGKAAINFRALRDTMMTVVRAAPSAEHLGRFERDNQGNLQRFDVALKSAKQEVISAIQLRRSELQAGASA